MKQQKLIEDAIYLCENEEVKAMLLQFLRANAVCSNQNFNLEKFVEKYTMRKSLTGIMHENGMKIATDGHILAAVKSDYAPENEGKIITPKGEIIDCKFPNWRMVVPAKENEITIDKPVSEILKRIKEAEIEAKIECQNVLVKCGDICFDTRYFKLFLSFLKAFADAKIYVKTGWSLYAVSGENVCLLMRKTEEQRDKIVEL